MAFTLNRRTLLKGSAAGLTAAIALPKLEAMLNDSGTAYADGTEFPVRFGLWFWCNGVRLSHWLPRPGDPQPHHQGGRQVGTVDASWTAGSELEPFVAAGLRDRMSVVTGSRLHGWSKATVMHHSQSIGVLTGYPQIVTGEYDRERERPSIVEVVAERWASRPEPPLISMLNFSSEGNVAWTQGTDRDPQVVFDRVFGAGTGGSSPPITGAPRSRRSILDLVLGEGRRLQQRLGSGDRERLERHLESIREIERRISTLPPRTLEPPPRPEAYGDEDMEQRHAAFARILGRALAMDITRTFCVTYGGPQSDVRFPQGGAGERHHTLTHEEDGDQPQVHQTVVWRMQQLADLLAVLRDEEDFGGMSVLDNTLVYGTTEFDEGSSHYAVHQPAILAGGAGGRLRQGLHYSGFVGDRPYISRGGPDPDTNQENHCKILLTILRALGENDESYGGNDPHPDSDGRNLGWGYVDEPFSALLQGSAAS